MIHPLPPGTRDVLPDEMRELRALTDSLRASFDEGGYREVLTPAMEYEEVLRRGDPGLAGGGYRLFDDRGRVLVLRSDMTVPIARLISSRLPESRPPFRLCYVASAYRATERGRGQTAEFLQAGLELIGPSMPEGDAEVVALTVRALEATGLRRHRVGVGDGSLFRNLLAEMGVADSGRAPLLEALSKRNLVQLEVLAERLSLSGAARKLLVRLAMLRGGPDVLDRAGDEMAGTIDNLRACHALLEEAGVADRVIFDLGLVRQLGYYTGAVFEVYDPAVGFALGGGGRYDELLGRFGRALPACGIALEVERVHAAQAAEERLG